MERDKNVGSVVKPGLPGWPLPMLKCGKCPLKFSSNVNCERHFHVIHKLKIPNRDVVNTRKSLGQYWDGLSDEEARSIVSFDADSPQVVKLKQLIWHWQLALPPTISQAYLRAGFHLLNIIQGGSMLPISSENLFSILDDASENTFLWGEVASVKGFIPKFNIPPNDVFAHVSFLLEERMVKAKFDHEEEIAEMTRQSLLGEEEAAKKRKAEELRKIEGTRLKNKAKKERKKARQNAAKVQESIENSSAPADLDSLLSEVQTSPTETSSSLAPDNNDPVPDEDQEQGGWCVVRGRRPRGSHAYQKYNPSKSRGMNKHTGITERAASSSTGADQVWRLKHKPAIDKESLKNGNVVDSAHLGADNIAEPQSSSLAEHQIPTDADQTSVEAAKNLLAKRCLEASEDKPLILQLSPVIEPSDNTGSSYSGASDPGNAATSSVTRFDKDIVMESDSDTSVDIAATKCLHASIRDLLGIPFEAVDKCIVQWIKLLHALDHPDCPGWPLLSSITSDEQLLKCDKCSRCFCSEINRNRHFHVEHKSKNHDQDSANTRRLALGEFWAGLSDEEKKEILSFEEVQLKVSVEKAKRAATHLSDEEVRLGVIKGSTLLEMVSDLVWFEAFPPLTRACMRAGYDLLDILQDPENPDIDRRLSISSEDLFSILDNASESTFLCGEAASMEEIVFGASNTSAIREINSIASSSFLLEKRMVEKMLSRSNIIAEARLADDARMAEALQASFMLDEARDHPEIYSVPTVINIKSAKDFLAERWKEALGGEYAFHLPSLDSEAPSDSAAGVESLESNKGTNLDNADNTGSRDCEANVSGKTAEEKIRTSPKKVLKSVFHGRREKDLIVKYLKDIHGDRYEFEDLFPHYESSGDESDTGNGKSESPSNSAANIGLSESFKVVKPVQDNHGGNTARQLLQREVSSSAEDTAGLSLEARISRFERMFALLVDVILKKDQPVQDKHEGNTVGTTSQLQNNDGHKEVSSSADDTAGLSLEARFSRLEKIVAELKEEIICLRLQRSGTD